MSLTYGFCLGEAGTEYNSRQFSDAFQQITGDGVCIMGGKLEMSISGFAVNLATGYALTAGRWVENDEPLLLVLPPSGNYIDRVDAVAANVNEEERRAALEILSDVDPEMPPDGTLYLVRIKRGATSLNESNVTDLRQYILPLSELSAGAIRVYQFLTSGIDIEVARLISLSDALAERADSAVAALNAAAENAGGKPSVGDLLTSKLYPTPISEWLLCDGSVVPDAYKTLSDMLGGTLPDISRAEDRYKTYIYSGPPNF